MPTIKTMKEMNLPELIEWAIKKDIKDEKFYSKNGCHISIDFRGHVFLWDIRLNETFTVEIEEEITEDTAIHKLIELSDKGLLGRTILNINSSINLAKTDESLAFYILNDDLTMTLIWKNGKLVD